MGDDKGYLFGCFLSAPVNSPLEFKLLESAVFLLHFSFFNTREICLLCKRDLINVYCNSSSIQPDIRKHTEELHQILVIISRKTLELKAVFKTTALILHEPENLLSYLRSHMQGSENPSVLLYKFSLLILPRLENDWIFALC